MFKPPTISLAFTALCFALASSGLAANAHAEEMLTAHTMKAATDAKPADAELSDFEWLQGAWKGEGLGADCDETWSSPAGGCMLGTFRMAKDEELIFTEFFMLVRNETGIVLKLKHFGSDFTGWETKDKSVDFPLIKVENKTAYFGGLTYQLQDDGSLKAYVAMKKKDGTYSEGKFHFHPTKPTTRQRSAADTKKPAKLIQ